jgi:hypothetical protein
LTVRYGSLTQLDLSWTDRSNNETGFEIQRQTPGGAWTPIATAAANATGYSDTGLTPLSTYIYRVRAVNTLGPSAYWSNDAWAETANPPARPPV